MKKEDKKKMKMRDKMLIFSVVMVLFILLTDITLLLLTSLQLDSVLVSEVIGYLKWLVGGSAGITAVEVVKGQGIKVNLDADIDEKEDDGEALG